MAFTYSGGRRRKLDLAMTLVTRPRIIFLDEPTTGLDPRSRRTMWNIVRELVADGVTVFLTTQNLEEADQLADRIAVLDQGRLVAQGTPDDLKRHVLGSHVRLQFTDAGELDAAARVLTGSTRDDEDLTLRVPGDGRAKSLRALLDRLDAHSIDVEDCSPALRRAATRPPLSPGAPGSPSSATCGRSAHSRGAPDLPGDGFPTAMTG